MQETERAYTTRSDVEQLRKEIDLARTELPPQDAAALSTVTVDELGQGVDPATIAILVAIAGNLGSEAMIRA